MSMLAPERPLETQRGGLSLVRRRGQAIHLHTEHGQTITVRVFWIHEGKCRLQILAPADCRIVRDELEPRDALPASAPEPDPSALRPLARRLAAVARKAS